MTKKQLKEKIDEYLKTLDDKNDDEWWCTPRELHSAVLERFIGYLSENK